MKQLNKYKTNGSHVENRIQENARQIKPFKSRFKALNAKGNKYHYPHKKSPKKRHLNNHKSQSRKWKPGSHPGTWYTFILYHAKVRQFHAIAL